MVVETGPLVQFENELRALIAELRLDWEPDWDSNEDSWEPGQLRNPHEVPVDFRSIEECLELIWKHDLYGAPPIITVQAREFIRHDPDFVFPYEEALGDLLARTRVISRSRKYDWF